ncbi:aminoglycoside phosphotransferase family protein [Amnibacterium setariae]|uniref:3'-kinase n=1 Tax=Amnibacterium setariae TaxID=2306585 RepID=A0A3A1TUT3_9MICO|nr:aminoglycoside phosphotransferase family protein [Amnibacterium setariae]RIX28013.1 3'-kinase [Amnibacterium setariae]
MDPDERLRAWGAEPTGERWTTPSSDLAAGVLAGEPVIVKAARIEEERRGNRLMAWWSEHGGLPVLRADGDAILMRRAGRSLLDLPLAEADRVIADVAVGLRALPAPPFPLVPLAVWFRDLVDRPHADPLLDRAGAVARELLARPAAAVVLHGDLHHGNVLDQGGRWVPIDPKGLVGHPAFDVANACCNPSAEAAADRLDARLALFSTRLGLDVGELADWVLAWCGLSICWASEAGQDLACRTVAERLLTSRS